MRCLRRSSHAGAAAVAALLAATTAVADEKTGDAAGTAPHVVVDKQNGACVGRERTGRVSRECTETTRVAIEREVTVNVTIAPKATKNCQATIDTVSEQRNTVARVQGTIEISDCTECSGDYTIVVRVRDESGETKSLEFPGAWQRRNGEPVKLAADFPIGANVDLLSVRPKVQHCVCADAPAPSADEK